MNDELFAPYLKRAIADYDRTDYAVYGCHLTPSQSEYDIVVFFKSGVVAGIKFDILHAPVVGEDGHS